MTAAKLLTKPTLWFQQQLHILKPTTYKPLCNKNVSCLKYLMLLLVMFMNFEGWGQATESFTNLPTVSASSYLERSWTGDDGVLWTATGARTDQTINGKAICFGSSSSGNRWVTSATYPNGIGALTFNYVRAFTGTNARSIEVYVNNNKIGNTITVSPSSNTVINYFEQLDISGDVIVEIRSVGSAQVKIDDVSWTAFIPACSAPTTQASDITFSNITTNAMDVNWTNGNGAGRVVVMNTVDTFVAPVDGDNPTVNTTYSGSGQQVIYNDTGSGPVSVLGLSPSTTYWFRVYEFCSPDRTYNTGSATNNSLSQVTNAPSGDTNSDIIETTSFSYNSNIAYGSFVNAGPLTTENSFELAQFTIRDGGANPDADAFATTLTNLSLSLSGHTNLHKIAVFDVDNSSNVAEVTAGASVAFSDLNLQAADDGTKIFSIRASFNSIVIDNDQLQVTITSTTAQSGGSLFIGSGDAGGASSAITDDINRIEVTASELNFIQQPTNTNINEAMSPAVFVEAIDANNNRDLDFTSNVSVTSSGTLTGAPLSIAAEEGLATFSSLTHTVAGTALTLTAAGDGLTDAISGSFDVVVLPSVFFIQDFEVSPATPTWGYTGGGTTDATTDKFNGARSYRISGSQTLVMNNIDLTGYTNVSLSVAFAASGPDSGEDLFMDISYDNGDTWNGLGSIKLVDGFSNTNLNINTTNDSGPTTVGSNPWITNINDSETQISVRFRINSASESTEYYWLDDILLSGNAPTPNINLSSPDQVSDATIATGATNQIISHFQAAVTDANATLNSLSFTTTGTYQATDVTGNFQLWYGASNVFANATSIGSVATGVPGTFDVIGLTQQIDQDTTGYFWITVDVDASATNGSTLQVSADPTLTFSAGSPTGTITQGGLKTFSTAVIPPTVITAALTNITHNSVTSGGEVTADGNASVTDRGVVYATIANPTLADNATTNGTGLGTYTSNVNGLSPQTQYFLRAYATNAGPQTGYGATELNFRTLSAPATAQASSLTTSNIEETSIELSFTGATFPESGAAEAGYVVLYNDGSTPTFNAANGEAPIAGTGSIFATSAVTLPSTPSTNINVTGLTGDTTYYFMVIPYTWDGSNAATYNYLTDSAPTVSERTFSGWQITAVNTTFTIDFDQTVPGVNNGSFEGIGFSPTPSQGQLDSDAWAVTGLSDGNLDFGGSASSLDFINGISPGDTTSGGIYAFETSANNFSLGVQPTSSDFAPGSITLKLQNQTGSTVDLVDIAYILYTYNDQNRSSSFNFSYSTDDITYNNINNLDYVSIEATDALPTWQSNSQSTYIDNLSLADQAFLYLRWSSTDVAGSGSRDEFALDDITAVFDPEDITYTFNNGAWFPSNPIGVSDTGDVLEIISGDAVISVDTSVKNITVNPEASLTVNSGITLTVNEGLTLNSTSNIYASLINDGTISGDVTYNRHVNQIGSGAGGGNDLVAPPLGGQAFNTFVTANGNLPQNGDNTQAAFAPFNNSTGAYINLAPSATTPLEVGIGYRAASTAGGALTFSGTVATTQVDVPITVGSANNGTAAWNLIGNPFPSYIDFNAFFTQNSAQFDEASKAVYGYNATETRWTIWNQATIDDLSETEYIAPGQGFFVKSISDGGTVSFTPAMRTTLGSDDFITGRSANSVSIARADINLETDGKDFNTMIYFNSNATRSMDPGYDASAYLGNASGIFTHLVEGNTGIELAIQSLAYDDFNEVIIPLGIKSNGGEAITISLGTNNTLPESVNVYLEDTVTGTLTLLNNSSYELTPESALNGTGRFFLRFTSGTLSLNDETASRLNIYNEQAAQTIVIAGQLANNTQAYLYDLQGRIVSTTALMASQLEQRLDVSNLSNGVYVLSFDNGTERISKKLIIR